MAKKSAQRTSPEAVSAGDVHVFGVRHLSPSGAWHLRRYLDEVKPELVLIEGLADANELIRDITRNGSEPPIAILAYTDSLPVRTLVYPLARYSPEYQALCWCRENDVPARFIDLPSDIFLALQDAGQPEDEAVAGEEDEGEEDDVESDACGVAGDASSSDADAQETGDDADDEPPPGSDELPASLDDRFAQLAGESDYETYWERNFEHNLSDQSYRLASYEFGVGLREFDDAAPKWRAENLVREAWMRRKIREAIAEGYAPSRIVAVVGAFHAPVLGAAHPPMTDEELKLLPRRGSKLTLMPYSYFRLSSQSGYGAGNHAPAYFELMWDALNRDDLPEMPTRYLSLVARHQRDAGTHRSTAEVIEGVRLARTLSAFAGGTAPTLRDLHDAAVTLIGYGDGASIQEALARVDVGTAIGRLPKGVSRTSIQDDFERELGRLKLDKYRTNVKQELVLDLRENRRAKTDDAAFLDLARSSFLHRLRVLDIGFGQLASTGQQSATWAEKWIVQWTPECEIRLVEAVLLGETVELAGGFKFKTHLEECQSVADAAGMVRDACQCGLMKAMDQARARLQELASGSSEFAAVAHAANELGMIVRYGDVRKFDPSPLLPLIEDLFVQGALSLFATANCDAEAAKAAMIGMDELNRVSLEYHERVDEELWLRELRKLSDSDTRNPLLSGYACSILLERNELSNDELAREVSRRLSPGISADLGAGWFEGLSRRNRYALLARQLLWAQLADYVASLDEEQFRRAIVFLRRAFGGFSPQEKRHISENLGEHWGAGRDEASEVLTAELSEAEQEKLDELNELNFDDL